MKKFIFIYFILLLVPAMGQSALDGKAPGAIFSKEEANKFYGEVLSSKEVTAKELKEYLAKTDKYAFFYFNGKEPVILNQTKEAVNVAAEDITKRPGTLRVFSVDKIKELLEKGGQDITTIEQRSEVISLTNGDYTLEFSLGCPPWCP